MPNVTFNPDFASKRLRVHADGHEQRILLVEPREKEMDLGRPGLGMRKAKLMKQQNEKDVLKFIAEHRVAYPHAYMGLAADGSTVSTQADDAMAMTGMWEAGRARHGYI